jgi:trimethylamine--corrinoid protein Co-methyltransferase
MKGFTRNFKPLEILTEEQVEAIQHGALDVLKTTGVRVEHDRALKLFEKNGCKVDYDEKRVRIPPGLVDECLHKCPSSFIMKARDPAKDLQIGGNTLYFKVYPGMRILGLDTWETRPATKQERDDGCIVMDALDNMHTLCLYAPYFEVEGIPPAMAIPEAVAAMLRNSTKIQVPTGYQLESEIFTMAMAKAAGTEIMSTINPSPPLTIHTDAAECLFRMVEAGFPVTISAGGLMGATIPATLAGAVIVNTAQNISGIVLAQLIKPGVKIISADFLFAMEMQSGAPVFGGIESVLEAAMFNQVWRKYGIPVTNGSHGPSNSKRIDFQCGYEKAQSALVAALSGSNFITFHGCVYGELAWHPAQAVLDDDIAGRIGHFLEGALVNDETLAIDLINEVGPIPGMYLDKAHTRQWWQKEQFMPKAADRLSYPEWMEQGKKSALDYAKERVEEIIATHKPKPLTASQDEEIERILEEARKYYKKRGLI